MTELNYQELVEGYYDNLNNNLRNFKGGPGFLETWVHDEDHNRSLLEILDLAHAHGISEMTIHLPSTVSSSLNLDWLRRNASEFGSLNLKGTDLTFSNAKTEEYVGDEFAGLSDLYIANLKSRAQTIRYEGALENKSGVYTAGEAGGTLSLAVGEKGMVVEAKHKGFPQPLKALMDAFCGLLMNRTLQEGAEHGTIRLESELRDFAKSSRTMGLLTLETSDPVFKVPQKLVRQIYHNYVQQTGDMPKRNFWRDPVPQAWLDLAYEDKLKEAQRLLNMGCKDLGLQEDVFVVKILNDTRLVLSYTQNQSKPDFGRGMIKLERVLRSQMNFEVELQLESIEDRNKRVERTKRV